VIGTGAIDHSSGGSGTARACFRTGDAGRRLRQALESRKGERKMNFPARKRKTRAREACGAIAAARNRARFVVERTNDELDDCSTRGRIRAATPPEFRPLEIVFLSLASLKLSDRSFSSSQCFCESSRCAGFYEGV